MRKNVIKEKSFDFALIVVKLYKHLCESKKEYVLSKQLLRSGTSVGANVRESEHVESKADFIHKLAISQKEANESEYWIELLYKSDFIDRNTYESISEKLSEIKKLLASILVSSKASRSK